jgi:hypothetical protein
MKLRWKKVASWDLSRNEQVVRIADGGGVQYKISRAGTADKPVWSLYTRLEDGTEERRYVANRLGDVKTYAVSMECHNTPKEG